MIFSSKEFCFGFCPAPLPGGKKFNFSSDTPQYYLVETKKHFHAARRKIANKSSSATITDNPRVDPAINVDARVGFDLAEQEPESHREVEHGREIFSTDRHCPKTPDNDSPRTEPRLAPTAAVGRLDCPPHPDDESHSQINPYAESKIMQTKVVHIFRPAAK
jgi:hypothetical protein